MKAILLFYFLFINIYASSQITIALCNFSNLPDGKIETNCFNLKANGIDYNPYYKKSIRFLGQGAFLYAEYNIDEGFNKIELSIEHLSAYAKNEGWAPISIKVNDQIILSNYSPEKHSYTIKIINITNVSHKGKNTILFIAEEIQTHYWLKRFDIKKY